MRLTESLIRHRFWIVCVTIILCAFLTPSQFQKGGIGSLLLTAIPVSALLLVYSYVVFLTDMPIQERVIIPIILWTVGYISMTILTEQILDAVFDDYNFGVNQTELTTF